MSKNLCKGGCGSEQTFKGWCKIKWRSGKRFAVACPTVEKRRGKKISEFRIGESKRGENPMQNPIICAKNHSEERNKKCSKILKKKGRLGILPQQIESMELKEMRRKNISRSLKKLFMDGRHPRQLESAEKRKKRIDKMATKLRELGKLGKLPVQNMDEEQRKRFGNKISRKLIAGIRSGKIKLSKSWKKVPYKNLVLRSEWEKIMAEFLDKRELKWEYETLKIDYWDSNRGVTAVTIPDFYIPKLNMVIEVKSNAEFNSQKTKDKTKAIIENGFNFILVGRKEINLIRGEGEKFLELMGVQGE